MISVYYYPCITDEQAKEEGGSMTCPVGKKWQSQGTFLVVQGLGLSLPV